MKNNLVERKEYKTDEERPKHMKKDLQKMENQIEEQRRI